MDAIVFDISVILAISAILSVLAFYLKQPIIIAYIACGMLVGPWGIGLIESPKSIETISHIGITLLLFLAGLSLHPQRLASLFKKTTMVTLPNCIISFAIVFIIGVLFDFTLIDSICAGLAMMFSSTILLVKLLPTTALHHERMGAASIAILILQDLLAILVLALMRSIDSVDNIPLTFLLLFMKLLLFISVLALFEYYVLRRLLPKIDRFQELIFIIGLAWCFGVASIANGIGLFYETGAFFAGVILARQAVSRFLSEKFKPLRDFFLVLFFFSLGAQFDFLVMGDVLLPSLLLAGILLVVKPFLFTFFFRKTGESSAFSKEAGIRLGQLSEFSLLIAMLAFELGDISARASQFIQLTTILTIFVSSFIVVFKYSTPIGTSENTARD
jgi:glutathione-regulated potassium-efflux system ancillary protein KefC